MAKAGDILRGKEVAQVYSITPGATVLEALHIMAERHIGALVVLEEERVVGILSERDYARKVALMERSSYNTEVRDIMTHDVVTVSSTTSIEQCMAIMTERRLRHLPVVDADRLLGMVSIGDLVKAIITHQKSQIDQLEQYIRGA